MSYADDRPHTEAVTIEGAIALRLAISDGFNDDEVRKFTFALIDPRDADAAAYYWVMARDGYPYRPAQGIEMGGVKRISLHRHIMGDDCMGLEVDHINRNRLDCRRANLRVVTRQENAWNTGIPRNNASGAKGVRFAKGCWEAYIVVKRKWISLGCYQKKENAISARAEGEAMYRKPPQEVAV